MNENQNNPPNTWSGPLTEAAIALKGVAEEYQAKAKRDARWTKIKRIFYVSLFATLFIGYWAGLHHFTAAEETGNAKVDSVALIAIKGAIAANSQTDADHISPLIEKACKNDKVKAIVLDIDSPGGSPTESERIIASMDRCRAEHNKPIYGLVESMSASAAYMIAMHTDRIYASRYAVVGSIGALITYFDLSDAAHRFGISQQIFRSMPLKGGPSMWTKTSPEDAAINDEMVKEMGKKFLADVIKSRGSKLKVDPEVLFSGRIWTSDQALAMGLIDKQAVLEDLKGTEFKGLKIVTFDDRSPAQRLFNTQAIIHQVMTELATPRIQ